MPRKNPNKYILQAQKLWRNFASSLHSNFYRFKRSKSLKRFKTVLGGKRSRFAHVKREHRHVYVDDLYMQPVEPTTVEVGEVTSHEMKENLIKKGETKGYCYNNCMTSDDSNAFGLNTRGAVPVWEMAEVDIRAEIFINKFKEDMRLQRQRSFKEYQEMLARGV
ncbi:transcription elongation factor [Rhynchospora pubera]|uniref:Transcription elongation factor n=1 Tax=Rhynchospora pubera TaxID=906938 RepID=A0AAV8G9Z5_9POAL|nr:transcription elongation factor [Rhynchospora pubera]